MGGTALQKHFGEAARRGADIEAVAAFGRKAKMIETGNQFQRCA